jgi:hypothetical protein
MTRRFYKHKLLLDENFVIRSALPLLNRRYDAKHIAVDLNLAGLSDPKVYKLAIKENRLLVTYNIKDFEKFLKDDSRLGVIGVSANLSLAEVDKKLTSLLSKSSKNSLFGKLTLVPGSSEDS